MDRLFWHGCQVIMAASVLRPLPRALNGARAPSRRVFGSAMIDAHCWPPWPWTLKIHLRAAYAPMAAEPATLASGRHTADRSPDCRVPRRLVDSLEQPRSLSLSGRIAHSDHQTLATVGIIGHRTRRDVAIRERENIVRPTRAGLCRIGTAVVPLVVLCCVPTTACDVPYLSWARRGVRADGIEQEPCSCGQSELLFALDRGRTQVDSARCEPSDASTALDIAAHHCAWSFPTCSPACSCSLCSL